MRSLIVMVLIAAGLIAGVLFEAYGQIDPCRALAVERARRAENTSGLPVAGIVEPVSRLQTSQMSTFACSSALLRSWGERLLHEVH